MVSLSKIFAVAGVALILATPAAEARQHGQRAWTKSEGAPAKTDMKAGVQATADAGLEFPRPGYRFDAVTGKYVRGGKN